MQNKVANQAFKRLLLNFLLKEKVSKNLHASHYRPDIDGLRAVAVLSVVLFHAFPDVLPGGYAGVDVFFVISGFLISTILFKSIEAKNFSITNFYARRIRRIFPALGLVLSSVLGFGWLFLFPDELTELTVHTMGSAGFIQNFILWHESGYFNSESDFKPLLHIWSLGIEEQFYFLWPLLLWGAGTAASNKRQRSSFAVICLLVFIVSFFLNLHSIKIDPTKTFYLPQYRFWELALGGILAWVVLYQANPNRNEELYQSRALSSKVRTDVLSFLGLVILLTVFIVFDSETVFPGMNALFPVLATAFILFAGEKSFINKKILSHKYLVWFGLISFPLYLWHWPILSFARIIYGEDPDTEFKISAIGLSVLLSWLTVSFVEKPFRFGNENARFKITFLCVWILSIGLLGLYLNGSIPEKSLTKDRIETHQIVEISEDNCKKVFPKWVDKNGVGTDQWCRIQSDQPTIALIGDSHSAHLFYGFVSKLRNTDEKVVNFPASCAAPMLDVTTGYVPLRPHRKNNGRLMNMAFDYIGKKSSIKTVYLAHNPDCSYNSALDLQNPNETNEETILKNGLIRTLKFLNEKNKNVVIVLDNPRFKFLPGRCKSRGEILRPFQGACEIEIDSKARDRYERIVKDVVSTQFPSVKVLNLSDPFCKGVKCSPMQNGLIMYPDNDGGHLNDEGSIFASEYLLKLSTFN